MKNITLMERVYKNNQFVLYINGFRGVISNKSMLESSIDVLSSLEYNITEINSVLALTDDIPNNEANYQPSILDNSLTLYLKGEKWMNYSQENNFLETGRNIYVNGLLVSKDGSVNKIASLLTILGHKVYIEAYNRRIKGSKRDVIIQCAR